SMIAFENMNTLKVGVGETVVCTLQCDVSAVMNTMDSITFRLQMATTSSNPLAQTPGTMQGVRAISQKSGQFVHVELPDKIMSAHHRFERGFPFMHKKNITPTATEFARISMTALGNRVHITGLQVQLINVIMNNNVGIQVYAGGLG